MANILVVDDDSAVLATARLILERGGHHVDIANDGRTGINLVLSGKPDLMLVDIFMPDMDGLEAIRIIHRSQPGLPIVVMSGNRFRTSNVPSPDFLHMATALGAVSSLPKPFRPTDLLDAVANALMIDNTDGAAGFPLPPGCRARSAPRLT
jgi:CheY-like chemotaxis protein